MYHDFFMNAPYSGYSLFHLWDSDGLWSSPGDVILAVVVEVESVDGA